MLKRRRGAVAPEERGLLLEGLALMMLRESQDRRRDVDAIHYWSPAEARDTEVDFLLLRGSRAVALEIKAAIRLREAHLQGLRAIGGLKGLERRVLVYLGRSALETADGIEVWPFETFAENLAGGKL